MSDVFDISSINDIYLDAKAEFDSIKEEALAEFMSPYFKLMLAGAAQSLTPEMTRKISPEIREIFEDVLGKSIEEVIGGNKNVRPTTPIQPEEKPIPGRSL